METWALHQPLMDHRALVGGVIVQDQVHVQILGHGLVDAPEELPELHGTMPTMALGKDLSCLCIQGGE